jgi:hypothetical protein
MRKMGDTEEFVFEQQSSNWLLEHLLSRNEQFTGCEVNIPETVTFENGTPKVYLKTNESDNCVTQIHKTSRNVLQNMQ